MRAIQMVDLRSQHAKIQEELKVVMGGVLESCSFIQGAELELFGEHLCEYTGSRNAIMVGSGTAALQIALLALGLQQGDEVITPSFSFVAAAEAIAILGLKPVLVDVDRDTMLISPSAIKKAITRKTKVIIPVHLFGQCAAMETILRLAKEHNLYVIEDACQAIGASYTFSDGTEQQAGTMGDFGCISFFPSKNLGCLGDGGAILSQKDFFAEKARLIANHGAKVKYNHIYLGVNSRLDTIQAAVLDLKLKYLSQYTEARCRAACFYDEHLAQCDFIQIPKRAEHSSHIFHQYTLTVKDGRRDALRTWLAKHQIPSKIYYPKPIHHQEAFEPYRPQEALPNAEYLSQHVLSLPMHTELDTEQLFYITNTLKTF